MFYKFRGHFILLIFISGISTFFYLSFTKESRFTLLLSLKRVSLGQGQDHTRGNNISLFASLMQEGESFTASQHDKGTDLSGTDADSEDDVMKLNSKAACQIPQINPYHEVALKELYDVGSISCPGTKFSYVMNGSLFLEANRIRFAHFQYVQRPAENDLQYSLSDPTQLVDPIRDRIKPGNIGCLVTQNDRILEFEDGEHISVNNYCTPEGFVEILLDGRIRNFDAKFLTVQECSTVTCSLAFNYSSSTERTVFDFGRDGIVRHVATSWCLSLFADVFGDYDELVLQSNCRQNAATWSMFHYPEQDLRVKADLTEDFVKLIVIRQKLIHTEYHANAISKPNLEMIDKKQLQQDDKMRFNIALITLESQSAANAERKMPKTFEYLETAENAFLFRGHTIVGDGTTDQLCAMLIGKLELDLPSAVKSSRNSVSVDEWPFIFAQFREKHYVTLFSEDDIRSPAFNYRLIGFKNPPTDHYARAFWLCASAASTDWRCIGDKPQHKINLDYTASFFDAYKSRPKFSVTVISAISHNNLNNIQYVDEDLLEFIKNMEKKGHLKDTLLFIVGDHGLRASAFRASYAGWLEERLPFFALWVPDALLRSDPSIRKTIDQNTGTITSHFDIHATLRDILHSNQNGGETIGQSLLSLIDRESRTCELAGVGRHWCPCRALKSLEFISEKHILVARAVVEYINAMKNETQAGKRKCSELELESIRSISYSNIDEELVQRNFNQTEYLVVLLTKPSSAIYEASVLEHYPKQFVVDPNISRLDLYGNQSKCILKQHPNLRKFCYCKKVS